jgi:hypothetical protein
VTEYTSSEAFSPLYMHGRGTKIFVEGVQLEEVREINIVPGKHVHLTMNWIPEATGQNYLIALFQAGQELGLEVNLPFDRGMLKFVGKLRTAHIHLPADVATLHADLELKDRTDDGPEVGIIKADQKRFTEALIAEIFQIPFKFGEDPQLKIEFVGGFLLPVPVEYEDIT